MSNFFNLLRSRDRYQVQKGLNELKRLENRLSTNRRLIIQPSGGIEADPSPSDFSKYEFLPLSVEPAPGL